LFSAAHGNLGSAGGINTNTMSEGRKMMRSQKGIRGESILNIGPKFLLVPAELETDSAQYLRSEADPDGKHSGVTNVFRNSLDLVVDAELDQYSSKAWYMAAGQNIADTFEV